MLSLSQETEFLKLIDEYDINLEKDSKKENVCWIEKPTSAVNLYLGIKPVRQIRFNNNYKGNIYKFECGNTYGILIYNERIIQIWRVPNLRNISITGNICTARRDP